jgi:hypothetical protein
MAAKLGGAKGDKYSIGQNSDINVTPFVDVMLVLLIIFMVSIPAATVAIKVDLPPAAPPKDINTKPVFISIRDNGTLDHPGHPGLRPAKGPAKARSQEGNHPDPRRPLCALRRLHVGGEHLAGRGLLPRLADPREHQLGADRAANLQRAFPRRRGGPFAVQAAQASKPARKAASSRLRPMNTMRL